jgi:hypothetical protein
VDAENPIKVWWVTNDKITIVDNQIDAIEKYKEIYTSNDPKSKMKWAYFEFGILNLSPNYRFADVYIEIWCGFNCGIGYDLYIQKRANGEWWIYERTFPR